MPYLDYSITELPKGKLYGKRGKNQELINEFYNSGKPFAELRLGDGEYVNVKSAHGVFCQSIKTLSLENAVMAIVREDRLFLVRK